VKKSRFTEEQIAFALKQQELGTPVEEICRKLGIAQATFFNWKKRFSGLGPSELRRLRQLEEGEHSPEQAGRRLEPGQDHAARRRTAKCMVRPGFARTFVGWTRTVCVNVSGLSRVRSG